MRIFIISDTHGSITNFEEAFAKETKEAPFDWLIHLGDVDRYKDKIAEMAGCKVAFVKGNNDYFVNLEMKLELEIAGVHILMTHGHQYGVSYGIENLIYLGEEAGADVVMFGHTHKPLVYKDEESGILFVNPGSLTFPRQEGLDPSYIVMEIGPDKEINCRIGYLDHL